MLRASTIIGSVDAAIAVRAAFPQRPAAPPDRRASCPSTSALRQVRRATPSPAACAPAGDRGRAIHACARGRRPGAALELRVDRNGGAELLLDARQRPSVNSRRRSALGLSRSAAPRTSVRAYRPAGPGSRRRSRCTISGTMTPAFGGQRLLDVGPRIAGILLESGSAATFFCSVSCSLRLAREQRVLVQRIELFAAHLDGVLDAVEQVGRDALVGRALRARTGSGGRGAPRCAAASAGVDVALFLELRDGEQAVGGAGMAGHEHRLAGRGPGEIELQVVGRARPACRSRRRAARPCRGTSAGTGSCPGRRRRPRWPLSGANTMRTSV